MRAGEGLSAEMVLATPGLSSWAPFKVVDAWIVYDKGSAMFPGLVRAPDGDLVLTFSTMPDGLPGGQVQVIRSSDNGRTWSQPQVVACASKPSAAALNAVGLTTLRDGTILLPYNEVELHGGYDDRDVSLFLLRSTDGGYTWSRPAQVARDIYEPCTYGQILECPDGTLLWPVWGRYRRGERWRSGLLRSRDRGVTWGEYRTIAYDPKARMDGDYRFSPVSGFDANGRFDPEAVAHPDFRPHSSVDGFNETSLMLLPDGTILAVLRQQGVRGSDRLELYQAVSTDGGDTWSHYEPIGICGMSPCLHWSPRGRLILAYRRSAPERHANVRPGVALSWSEDGGHTWEGELVLTDPKGYCYTAEYQAGYPALINLDDSNILIVFYSYSPELPHGRYLAANLVHEIDSRSGGRYGD